MDLGESPCENEAVARCTASAPEPAAKLPDVLLVVLDTVRADRLSTYGYERPTSIQLDGNARRELEALVGGRGLDVRDDHRDRGSSSARGAVAIGRGRVLRTRDRFDISVNPVNLWTPPGRSPGGS